MMNKRICKRLFLIGMALSLVLAGCGDSGEPKSTETAITELTLTIEGVAKTITFGTDGTANVALSESVTSTMPTSATVKSVTLSAGASGLVKDQKLTLTEGSVTVTITAEDGTTKKEYTVTVTIGDKLNLNTVALSYADVETTAGTANDTGVDPQWVGSPTPEGITYSITNYAPPGGGNGVDGSDGDSPAVAIDADGKITITDAAEAENSGTYTVTATAGASSNYEANATQTATVTVTIAKRNLGTATFSYTVKKALGAPYDGFFKPVWTLATGAPTPEGITYSITAATGASEPNTDGTAGGTPVVDIDPNTGEITITAAAVEANSGDYTVEATANQNSSYLNGSKQTTTATVKVIVYNVGDDGPAGGKVFYDEGDYTKGWRYLEAAPSDHGSVVVWGGDGNINGGTQDGIGSGKANTDAIVATLQDNENKAYAAKICNELDEGGFTDWFLPSKDELYKLYEQKDTLYEQKDTVGGFSSGYYWSSSVNNSNDALTLYFGDGSWSAVYRDNTVRVRAVRAF